MIPCLYYAHVYSVFFKFLINLMYVIPADCYCYIEGASSYPGARQINFNFSLFALSHALFSLTVLFHVWVLAQITEM